MSGFPGLDSVTWGPRAPSHLPRRPEQESSKIVLQGRPFKSHKINELVYSISGLGHPQCFAGLMGLPLAAIPIVCKRGLLLYHRPLFPNPTFGPFQGPAGSNRGWGQVADDTSKIMF